MVHGVCLGIAVVEAAPPVEVATVEHGVHGLGLITRGDALRG